jgi:hypothetical protein
MNARLLVAESDWQVLDFVYRDLRERGYDVMVEADVDRAKQVVSHWRPDMVIIAGHHLAQWECQHPELVGELMASASFLVTVSPDEPHDAWSRWLGRGCEILFKPLVHVSELRVAADAAMLAKVKNYSRGIGKVRGVYGNFQAG